MSGCVQRSGRMGSGAVLLVRTGFLLGIINMFKNYWWFSCIRKNKLHRTVCVNVMVFSNLNCVLIQEASRAWGNGLAKAHQDLSSDPQNHIKAKWAWQPPVTQGCGGQRSRLVRQPPRCALGSVRDPASVLKAGGDKGRHLMTTSSFHMCTQTPVKTCTLVHTRAHRHENTHPYMHIWHTHMYPKSKTNKIKIT